MNIIQYRNGERIIATRNFFQLTALNLKYFRILFGEISNNFSDVFFSELLLSSDYFVRSY